MLESMSCGASDQRHYSNKSSLYLALLVFFFFFFFFFFAFVLGLRRFLRVGLSLTTSGGFSSTLASLAGEGAADGGAGFGTTVPVGFVGFAVPSGVPPFPG